MQSNKFFPRENSYTICIIPLGYYVIVNNVKMFVFVNTRGRFFLLTISQSIRTLHPWLRKLILNFRKAAVISIRIQGEAKSSEIAPRWISLSIIFYMQSPLNSLHPSFTLTRSRWRVNFPFSGESCRSWQKGESYKAAVLSCFLWPIVRFANKKRIWKSTRWLLDNKGK